MEQTARALHAIDVRGRQLNAAQRRALRGASWAKVKFVILLAVLTAPFVLFASSCLLLTDLMQWWSIALLGFVPLGLMLSSGAIGLWVIGRNRRSLERACAAVPPRAPGEPASCHVCGGPLSPGPGELVARCGFCHADNCVDPKVLERIGRREARTIDAYEREVAREARALGRRSELATYFALSMVLVAPVAGLVATLIVIIGLSGVGTDPDETRTYTVVTHLGASCLAEVTTGEGSKPEGDMGLQLPPIGFAQREPLTRPFETLRVRDVLGRRVHTTRGVGEVVAVKGSLVDLGSNFAKLRLADGSDHDEDLAGMCLVDLAHAPTSLAVGNWVSAASRSRSVLLVGPKTTTELGPSGKLGEWEHPYDSEARVAADDSAAFVSADGKIYELGPAGPKPWTELGTRAQALALDERSVHAALADEVRSFDRRTGAPTSRPLGGARALVVSHGRVFAQGKGLITRLDLGESVALVTDSQMTDGVLGADQESVYYAKGSELWRAPAAGGSATRLADVSWKVTKLAGNDRHLVVAAVAPGNYMGAVLEVDKSNGEVHSLAARAVVVDALMLWGSRAYVYDYSSERTSVVPLGP